MDSLILKFCTRWGECLLSGTGRLTPGEKHPVPTRLLGARMSNTTDLDVQENRKVLFPVTGIETRFFC